MPPRPRAAATCHRPYRMGEQGEALARRQRTGTGSGVARRPIPSGALARTGASGLPGAPIKASPSSPPIRGDSLTDPRRPPPQRRGVRPREASTCRDGGQVSGPQDPDTRSLLRILPIIDGSAGRSRPGIAGASPDNHRSIEVFSTDWSFGGGEDECCRGDGADSAGAEANPVEGFPSGFEQGDASFAWGS